MSITKVAYLVPYTLALALYKAEKWSDYTHE